VTSDGFEALFSLPVKSGGMAIDPEVTRQVALSLVAVLIFVVAASAVNTTYGSNEMVGIAIVGLMILFILMMAAAGLWLARQDFDSE